MITLPLANVSNETIIRLIECGKSPILSSTSTASKWRFLRAAQTSYNDDGELVMQYEVESEHYSSTVLNFIVSETVHESWRISFESPIRSVWEKEGRHVGSMTAFREARDEA